MLKRNFSWALIGNVTLALSQFIILIIFTKLGGPIAVGQYTLALAICAPIFLFLSFKLRAAISTDKKNEFDYNEYSLIRRLGNIVGVILVIIILIMSNYSFEVATMIFLMSILKVFESQSEIIFGALQKKERMKLISISYILRGTLSVPVVFVTYLFLNDLVISIIGLIIVRILILYTYDKKNLKDLGINQQNRLIFNKKILSLLLLVLPLGISVTIGSLKTNVPRYFIEGYLGQYELGIFASISYLLVAFGTMISSLSQAVLPRLSQYYGENDNEKFKSLLSKLISFGFLVGLFAIILVFFFGEIFLTLVYSREYAAYNHILLLITCGAIFQYATVFLGTSITAMRKFKKELPVHSSALIAITIASYALIPKFGLEGAAIALVIGFIVSTIGYIITYLNLIRN
ncbi:oligosaccharide flippase family protein [Alteribacter keqinensis]|uniref:oligosaccharide flippase family protein n=1 Tax=Alteribacter keqinensis TaxID=2483800 RepID=UPI001605FF13|nr:oligosaccharide flippase family protein [Alteribacter keqinensis]